MSLLRTSATVIRASVPRVSSRALPLLTRHVATRTFATTRYVYFLFIIYYFIDIM